MPTIDSLIGMVKVMDSVVAAGGKVAVHCHAGLGRFGQCSRVSIHCLLPLHTGRTGLLIASYLVFSQGLAADAAISLVRTYRRGAVQTDMCVGVGVGVGVGVAVRGTWPMSATPSHTHAGRWRLSGSLRGI